MTDRRRQTASGISREEQTMKIEYIWHDKPKEKKIYDTKVAYSMTPRAFRDKTQEEFDQKELESLEKNKARGLVLEYRVVEP